MQLMPSSVVAGAALAASTLLFICLWLHHPRHLFDKVMINTYVCLWNFRPNYIFFFFLSSKTTFLGLPLRFTQTPPMGRRQLLGCLARAAVLPSALLWKQVARFSQCPTHLQWMPATNSFFFFEAMHSFCNEWEGVPNSFMHRKEYTVFK